MVIAAYNSLLSIAATSSLAATTLIQVSPTFVTGTGAVRSTDFKKRVPRNGKQPAPRPTGLALLLQPLLRAQQENLLRRVLGVLHCASVNR